MINQDDTDASTVKYTFSDKESEYNPVTKQEPVIQESPPHPRANLPVWRWRGTLLLIYLCSIQIGYDISNVANIQPRLYEAFGHIDLLPWIGLSYSIANFSVGSLARKISIAFDMRVVFLFNQALFLAGSAIAGAAKSMSTVIVGRIVMGIGGCIVQQSCYSYIAAFTTPAETTGVLGIVGGVWALGLIIGGPIGSAFSENETTTWRWAFYINIPFIGLAFIMALVCLPPHVLAPDIPLAERIRKLDPVGILLHMASGTLFAIAVTFSGAVWNWGSGPDIAIWVLFGVVFVSWGVQQYFCFFTTKEDRAFPVHLLSRGNLVPLWLGCFCAGASYAISLYYTPLFFAFARGYDAMQQTVRFLPFILVFILSVSLTGRILPLIGRYCIIYIVGGCVLLASGAAMANIMNVGVPESQIMGLEALIGIGVGMTFQHGIGISNVINKDPRDRFDSLAVCNMAQMGGIAVPLAIAGSIFQNIGYTLLVDALGEDAKKYSEKDVREALAGVSSIIWRSENPAVLRSGIEAVAKVIAREYYLIVAFGFLSLVSGLLMKWEKIDFGRQTKTEELEA